MHLYLSVCVRKRMYSIRMHTRIYIYIYIYIYKHMYMYIYHCAQRIVIYIKHAHKHQAAHFVTLLLCMRASLSIKVFAFIKYAHILFIFF